MRGGAKGPLNTLAICTAGVSTTVWFVPDIIGRRQTRKKGFQRAASGIRHMPERACGASLRDVGASWRGGLSPFPLSLMYRIDDAHGPRRALGRTGSLLSYDGQPFFPEKNEKTMPSQPALSLYPFFALRERNVRSTRTIHLFNPPDKNINCPSRPLTSLYVCIWYRWPRFSFKIAPFTLRPHQNPTLPAPRHRSF
ncbi:hypothetical protein EV126DRAFT_254990 [Verticillium dahliae]|nr:hypothetical protein EV126DRAFT_254990 [Verticillium dahliae]